MDLMKRGSGDIFIIIESLRNLRICIVFEVFQLENIIGLN